MRADESQGFADFVSAEQAALLRLAVLLTGGRADAEDLVQTALMKTYGHWPRISRSGPPSAYVRRVMVTTHTSWRRRLSSTEQVVASLPDRADPAAEHEAADEELRTALMELPPRMRTAVVLRFYEDLTEQGAADLMGCSASTVNTQTARGLARLRQALTCPPLSGAGTREERRCATDGDGRFHTPVSYRVVRDGRWLVGAPELHPQEESTGPDLRVSWLRTPLPISFGAAGSPPDLLAFEMETLLGRTGLSADEVDFTAVWAGEERSGSGTVSRLTLVTGELPSGAVWVGAVLTVSNGAGFLCGSEIRPAGPPVASQVFVVTCRGTNRPVAEGLENALVVVAPPGTTTARALDDDGRVLGEYPLTDGVAVVPAPSGMAAAEVLAADGSVLDRRTPPGVADLGQ